MESPVVLLLIATLLPLASFTLLVFLGKRLGNPLAGWVATIAIGLSCAASFTALIYWIQGGNGWGMDQMPISRLFAWVPTGAGMDQDHAGCLDIGIYVDSLTVLMFCMITLVSMLVHVFSIGYMAEDKRFPRFFTYLGLFCFSMLGLVLGGTILHLFIFWELVGLCSYLLIGFWYEKKSASNAAIKAFVVNRVGDFGFLIGLGILFYHFGNVSLPDLWRLIDMSKLTPAGLTVTAAGATVSISSTLLTVMGIGLFFGAVGKSAQFPLHVWLPDAMEGPTPVSALIHAATMVAAGVYLVGRIFPILTPGARLFIAIIGVTTLAMAALIAVVQSDIKKVLAYSTLSQLGYMILAMGIGSWVGGLFHLITHAFFKALLFLGSGSVIHAAHHEQELPKYGGLWRKIPVTAVTFAIAVLAIAGVPYLSGYYSKDMILAHAGAFASLGQTFSKYYWLFFIIPAVIAYVTAFYMTRCWMLTFAGKPRDQHLYDHAHESGIMYVPLIALALFSVIAGYKMTLVRGLIESTPREITALVNADAKTGGESKAAALVKPFSQAWPAELPGHGGAAEAGEEHAAPVAHASPSHAHASAVSSPKEAFIAGEELVAKYIMWAPLVGILAGVLLYARAYAITDRLMKIAPLRWVHTWLYRRMYFDELYMGAFVMVTLGLSRLSAAFDKYIVDGLVNLAGTAVRRLAVLAGIHDRYVVDGAVNGTADAAQLLGAAVRVPQNGRIRLYVTVVFAIAAMGIAAAVAVAVMGF